MTDNIHKLLEGEETIFFLVVYWLFELGVNPYETLKPFYEVVTA